MSESTTVDPKVEVKKDTRMMAAYLEKVTASPQIGDMVEGPVINIEKSAVYVDLFPFGTGIIYGREYIAARDIIKKLPIGDKVSAKIVDIHEKDGYYELSLKEAKQAIVWGEALEAVKEKRPLEIVPTEANKGGLIIVWQGIQGFLPASQLKAEHYPRVADGDKDKILEELKKLVGQRLIATIISAVPNENKLIFSEKVGGEKEKEKIVEKYKVGDTLDGEITGIVDFGAFVKVEEGLEGLVHISELDWSLVEDPRQLYRVGDRVKVKVIEVKDGKVSLSIKALKPNPWQDAAKKYKKDSVVEGTIIKFNKYGALASIEEGVAGLVHVSEFGNDAGLRAALELGKSYQFKITSFDAKSQKMTLSYGQAK
ncbi:MAG TPA: S1 RNA-binding domain-containing protein [Candidatus Paceibacterota bacterium]|nr:S1 RNA-binding domain-containing protein [Candidatus Paceibacterota bacterium]